MHEQASVTMPDVVVGQWIENDDVMGRVETENSRWSSGSRNKLILSRIVHAFSVSVDDGRIEKPVNIGFILDSFKVFKKTRDRLNKPPELC